MKYTIEYVRLGNQTEDGKWHEFRILCGAKEVATCCVFIWSVSGKTDEDGSNSEAGEPDCNGLHFGDGADRPDESHADLDLSDMQAEALALTK